MVRSGGDGVCSTEVEQNPVGPHPPTKVILEETWDPWTNELHLLTL